MTTIHGKPLSSYSIPVLKSTIRIRKRVAKTFTILSPIILILSILVAYSFYNMGDTDFALLYLVFAIVGIVLLFVGITIFSGVKVLETEVKELELEKDRQNHLYEESLKNHTWQIPLDELIAFIKDKEITNCSSEASYQRLVLIVKAILDKHEIPEQYQHYYTSRKYITKLFEEATQRQQEEQKRIEKEQQQQEVKQEKEKEKKFEEGVRQIANLIGREKMLNYTQQKIFECQKKLQELAKAKNSVNNATSYLARTNKANETDWGLYSGIANAIGGPAAGVSTAVNIQNRNEAAKAHNRELYRDLAQLRLNAGIEILHQEESVKRDLNSLIEKEKAIQSLLIEDIDKQQLLDKLSLKIELKKSITHAVYVTIEWDKVTDFKIYEDVPAIVDGSVRVLLRTNGSIVGSAIVALPPDGAREKGSAIGICTNISCFADTYDYTVEPYHLWAIEKPPFTIK